MSDRLIVVTAHADHVDLITAIAEQAEVVDRVIYGSDDDARRAVHLLVAAEDRQQVIDRIQVVLDGVEGWRITIYPVEATIPRVEPEPEPEAEDAPEKRRATPGQTREELYNDVARNARLDWTFVTFVILSTIVAAIGLIEDNVAVVIGAMVIAPLLGPILASALGVALGDRALMLQGAATNAAGVAIALAVSFAIGVLLPGELGSDELMARTDVGFDGVALALASGAAAALSLTTGLSSALVGVMVAVALLPPAATIGLMLGAGQFALAGGAALLLAVNVVCVNLSAQAAFVLRGVTPRTWLEKKAASRAVRLNAALWIGLLAALALLLALRARTGAPA